MQEELQPSSSPKSNSSLEQPKSLAEISSPQGQALMDRKKQLEEIKVKQGKRTRDSNDHITSDDELDSPEEPPLNLMKGLITCDPGSSPTVAQKRSPANHNQNSEQNGLIRMQATEAEETPAEISSPVSTQMMRKKRQAQQR